MDSHLVILTSGGLDSMIAYHYAQSLGIKHIVNLHVNLGQPYAQKELESVQTLGYPVTVVDAPIIHMDGYDYPKATVDQQIIAGRNMTLATLGANFGNRIWMCALKGEFADYMVDKNRKFFHLASGVLSYTFGRDIEVETPFSELTKTDVVALGLRIGVTEDQMRATTSCYDDHVRNCGLCSTCVKRATAFVLNNIEEHYQHDPFESPYVKQLINRFYNNDSSVAGSDIYRLYELHNALIKTGHEGVLNLGKEIPDFSQWSSVMGAYGWNPYYVEQTGV